VISARFERAGSLATDHSTSGDATNESRWTHGALLVLIAWCTYLHLPLVSGDRLLVPSYPTVILAPLLLLVVRKSLPFSDMVFLLKVTFLLLLSIALSPGYVFIEEKFLGMVQFSMAVAVAVLIVRLMLLMSQASLERTLLLIWCMVLIGSVLEVLDVTREISDEFRTWAYQGTYTLYSADLRDLNLVGWSRPKLFSSEPSHVTKFFIAAINSWLLVRVTGMKVATVAGATLAMLVIMGSPMLLVSAAMTLVILVWDRHARIGGKVAAIAAVVLVAGFVGAYFSTATLTNVASRVTEVSDASVETEGRLGGDERRIILPYVTLVETWLSVPIFGVGVGGKEVVAARGGRLEDSTTQVKGNNALADIGIFLGLVGGSIFIYLLMKQAGASGVRRLGLFAVVMVLFSQLMGGIDTFRYWGFVALLWGAMAVSDRADDDRPYPLGI
jgi:hypothetical protein